MRILHTSDWHLGRVFNKMDLQPDQAEFLNQIIGQIEKARDEKNPYSAILIAGDIYDKAVPSAEATEMFDDFLWTVHEKFPELCVFIISGNHDSPVRLAYAKSFFKKYNIHIITDTKGFEENKFNEVVLDEKGEKAVIYGLPYLYALSIKSGKTDDKGNEIFLRNQQDLYDAACEKIRKYHEEKYGDTPSVMCAHLFSIGAVPGGSERSCVGDSERVDIKAFKGFTYSAFGHIHGYHVCDYEKRCFYSGSPLAYNFDDNPDTFMLDVTLKGNEVPDVKKIQFKPLHPLVKLSGKFEDFCGIGADLSQYKKYENYYVQVILDDQAFPENAFSMLEKVFPHLVSFVPKEFYNSGLSGSIQQRKEAIDSKDPIIIFKQFLTDIYGEDYKNNFEKISEEDEGDKKEQKELVQKELELLKDFASEIKWGSN